jgi:hypothetical protein
MMTLESILNEFRQSRGYFPQEAVQEALQRREEITPHLLRSLQEAAQLPSSLEPEEPPFLPIYAMYLLAQFRDQRACPLIIDLCKLPIKELDRLLSDLITEGLPRIIASVFDGNIEPIKSIIENESLDPYVRGSALRSLSILVYEDVLPRADVISYMTELFRGRLEKKHSHIWDELASEAVDLHAISLAEDIQKGYEEGLLSPGYMNFEDAERSFAMLEEDVLAHSKANGRGLINDAIKEMGWWACFRSEKASRHKLKASRHKLNDEHLQAKTNNPETVMRSHEKIGRNDPCPCGSGKKYKKCCAG